MTSKLKSILAALILTSFIMAPASANSLRCGTHVISEGGDYAPGQYEVLKRCGEPDVRSGRTWVYKRGSIDRLIKFDSQGQVLQIL